MAWPETQSSRRLQREAQRNVELMWLKGRLAPDAKLKRRMEEIEANVVLAQRRRPERWSGHSRDWKLNGQVWLNPERNPSEALGRQWRSWPRPLRRSTSLV